MAARYSNTSSRGLVIVVSTVIGSIAARSLWLYLSRGPVIRDPHRVAELGSVNETGRERPLAVDRAAELAAHRPRCVHVDALADQRCAMAVRAALATGCERVNAPPQQRKLQRPLIRDVSIHWAPFSWPRRRILRLPIGPNGKKGCI